MMPPLGAGMRRGSAWVIAPTMASLRRMAVALRIPTAAGGSGLTTVPRGASTVTCSNMPWLSGTVLSWLKT